MTARKMEKHPPGRRPKLAAAVCMLLAVCSAGAQTNNLLSNGNFNAGSSGWSTFTYGGGYVSFEIPATLAGTTPTTWPAAWPGGAGTNAAGTGPLYDGSLQLTCGAASGSAGGFAWQIVAGAPNVQYTLTCQGGAQNWWLPTGQIRLWFLDTNSAAISSNFVETTYLLHNSSNGGLGDQYDVGVPYQNWTNTAVSPPGTTFVKVELCNPNGTGSAWFDNAKLTAPISPPVIANLYPDGSVLLQGTNQFSFQVTSAAPLNRSGIVVTINGTNVSGSLVVTGSGTTNVNVSYSGLKPNQSYTAVISVTDTVNPSSFKNITFDTFTPSYVWESEDYDFSGGQFINNPVLSNTANANSYFGVSGTAGIDFYDWSASGPQSYRPDAMSTSVSGDTPRQNFVDAGVLDYVVGYFNGAGFTSGGNVGLDSYVPQEWVNYTRNFTPGTYNIYARIAGGNGGTATVPLSLVVSGQRTSSQTVTNLGNFSFPADDWGAFHYVPLTDQLGNKVQVALSGTETLRVSAGSGANLNFFMLIPPDTDTPTITGVYPDGTTLVQGTNELAFTVGSASHVIPQTNVMVVLNGVTNNNLAFSGSNSSWNVSVPLSLNVASYTAVISVRDNAGNSQATTVFFDTFDPASYDIEAEDFDFNGGQYIDNPVITSTPSPNSYFDTQGTAADEYPGDVLTPPTADYHFRSLDGIATSLCGDTPTRQVLAAQATNSLAFNYNVAWWSTNGWLNYTHNYPAGSYNVYARVAGNAGSTNVISLDILGASNNHLGAFVEVGRGYNLFHWVPLVNTNTSQRVTISLNGLATLRTTSVTGNINPNSYLLVPASVTAPTLYFGYAAGAITFSWSGSGFHLQSQTGNGSPGLGAGWSDYSGGSSSPVTIPLDKSKGSVFFRLSQ